MPLKSISRKQITINDIEEISRYMKSQNVNSDEIQMYFDDKYYMIDVKNKKAYTLNDNNDYIECEMPVNIL